MELKCVHESKGSMRKATLYKQLYRMRKVSETIMNIYINNFTNKAEQLVEVEIKIPDDLLSIMLLSSLPNDFENFSIVIESRDEVPSIDSLKIKLLEEEACQNERAGRSDLEKGQHDNALLSRAHGRDKHKRTNSSDKSMLQNQKKFTGKCFNCAKIGYKNTDCQSKTKRGEMNNKNDNHSMQYRSVEIKRLISRQ